MTDDLLLSGIGNMPHLRAAGQDIWVIFGDNCQVENIEFSEAAVLNNNGSGSQMPIVATLMDTLATLAVYFLEFSVAFILLESSMMEAETRRREGYIT